MLSAADSHREKLVGALRDGIVRAPLRAAFYMIARWLKVQSARAQAIVTSSSAAAPRYIWIFRARR